MTDRNCSSKTLRECHDPGALWAGIRAPLHLRTRGARSAQSRAACVRRMATEAPGGSAAIPFAKPSISKACGSAFRVLGRGRRPLSFLQGLAAVAENLRRRRTAPQHRFGLACQAGADRWRGGHIASGRRNPAMRICELKGGVYRCLAERRLRNLLFRRCRVSLELHWRIEAARCPDSDARWWALWADRPSDFSYTESMHLCSHGAIHAWSHLKWAGDLWAIVDRQPELWQASQGTSAALGLNSQWLIRSRSYSFSWLWDRMPRRRGSWNASPELTPWPHTRSQERRQQREGCC